MREGVQLYLVAAGTWLIVTLTLADTPVASPQVGGKSAQISLSAYRDMLDALLSTHDYHYAERTLLAFSEKFPKFPLPYYHLGVMAEARGDYELALIRFRTFLSVAPTGPYAELVQKQLSYFASLQTSSKDVKTFKTKSLLAKFYYEMDEKDTAAAHQSLVEAQSADPASWEVMRASGYFHFFQKNYIAAEADFDGANKVCPLSEKAGLLAKAKSAHELAGNSAAPSPSDAGGLSKANTLTVGKVTADGNTSKAASIAASEKRADPLAEELKTKVNAGLASYKNHEYHVAANEFGAAWQLQPTSAYLALYSVDSHLKAHEETDALKQLQQLKAKLPTLHLDNLIAEVSKAVHLRQHISELQTSLNSHHHSNSSMSDEFLEKLH